MTEVAKPLYGKVILNGIINTVTGLHIGAGREAIEIGALDNPVLIEPLTKQPYIPGSSIKGKLRSLLEKREAHGRDFKKFFNRNVGRENFPIWIHVCDKKEDAFNCPICRLFGSSGGRENQGSNFPSRLRTRDSYLTLWSETNLREAETDLLYTEIKYENALDRITAAANPRPIERVPAGTDFTFEMIYDVENLDHLQDDLHNLAFCLSVLEDDYLGGHGSRGYGKVKIWLTRVVVKKVEAYLSPSDEHQKVIIDGQEIDRKNPTERPEDVKPVDAFRDAIDKIVEFFTEEK